jgi:hypothetical protein
MPGLEISSTNTALPVALSGVSMRFARVLIIWSVVMIFFSGEPEDLFPRPEAWRLNPIFS